MRVGLLVNPAAGGGRGEARAGEARDLIGEHEVVERTSDRRAGAGGVAAEMADDVDVLAPVGGDGTLREVVEALAGAGPSPPLLPVPAGRGNSTVTHLYGEDGWRRAARTLEREPATWPLDAGALEGDGWGPRIFVLGASVGLLAGAVRAADGIPLLPGRAAYRLGTVWTWLRAGAEPVRVAVDGKVLHEGEALLAAVAGGEVRGGGVPLFPGASLADGLLDVLVVEAVSLRRAPRLSAATARGTHGDLPWVHQGRGSEVTIRREELGAAELDGTLFPGLPARLEAEVRPGAARVVALPQGGGSPPGVHTES